MFSVVSRLMIGPPVAQYSSLLASGRSLSVLLRLRSQISSLIPSFSPTVTGQAARPRYPSRSRGSSSRRLLASLSYAFAASPSAGDD